MAIKSLRVRALVVFGNRIGRNDNMKHLKNEKNQK